MTAQRLRQSLCIDWDNVPDSDEHAIPHAAVNGHRALCELERALSQYRDVDIERVITRPFSARPGHYVRTFVDFTYAE